MINTKNVVYEGAVLDNYTIDTIGCVYNMNTGKYLSQFDVRGYMKVSLLLPDKNRKLVSVHRLVAMTFIPNPHNKPQVNHIDGNKHNNSVNNLEWVTESENIIHAYKTGLKIGKRGSLSHLAKYDDNSIELVCKLLSEGILTLKEISKMTGVNFATVYSIIDPKTNAWKQIADKYDVMNYYRDRSSYTHKMYEIVFSELENNELSMYAISDKSGVAYSSIINLIRRVPNPYYNDLYAKYDISKYNGGTIPYDKVITDEMKTLCNKLYSKGIPVKYIKRIVSHEYDINSEKIRVYIRDRIQK